MNNLCQRQQAELTDSQATASPRWMSSPSPKTSPTVTDKWWLYNSGNGVPAFVLVSFCEIPDQGEGSLPPSSPSQPSLATQLPKDSCHSLCRYQRRHCRRHYRSDADCQVVYVGLMERTHDKCAALVRSDCTLETLLSDNYVVNCTPECRPDRSSARKTHRVDLSASSDAFLDLKESSNEDGFVSKQLRKFVRTIGGNYLRVKTRITTSSSYLSIDDDGLFNGDSLSMAKKLHDVRKNSSTDLLVRDPAVYEPQLGCADSSEESNPAGFVIEPQSIFYVLWLCLITVAFLYNCWVIPLRTTFPYQTEDNVSAWLVVDYSMDLLYLLDIVLMKPRVMYLEDGFWVRDPKLTRKNYLQKLQFKMDVLSLLPSDLLYFVVGIHPMFRLPRLLKIQTFWEFFNHFDNILASPYVVRVTRTLTYMLYLVHLNTCAYYAVSVREGIGSNTWVYDGEGNAYIRCFYRATKTATSIGKNPKPSNEIEYLFMTYSWLMGVFVFATLIGQIRDIVATASKSQNEYRKLVDETLDYLRRLNVPPKIRERVEQWFSFTWEQQHTLDESKILDTLPQKLKTDVAINVHIKTLGKVQLFHDCDEALLRDLVLKLRPVLYLPGDYICRKGEVGKEMYIVKTGQVQVVTRRGRDNNVVLATLTEGCVFGEISLLNLAGTNRRTADVRSHGFSSLFVLSKNDLNEAIRYYPNAQKILKQKARQLIRQNASREGREMPLEIMYDSNESLSKAVAITTTTLQPLSATAKKESSTSEKKQKSQQPPKVAIYKNNYSSLKRYSDAQVSHFVRLRKRRNKQVSCRIDSLVVIEKYLVSPVKNNAKASVPALTTTVRRVHNKVERVEDYELVPPDGGWGWLVLFGATLINLLVPGIIKSFGVLFVEFLETYKFSEMSASWIPALSYFLYCSLGPLASYLSTKLSYRTVTLIGGAFASLGMILSCFASSIIHLCITYGLLFGTGAGLSFPPGIFIVTSYFQKYRGFANGIAISGSAFGSMILPPLLRFLLHHYGLNGTVLIMGGITMNVWVGALLYHPVEWHLKRIPIPQPPTKDVPISKTGETVVLYRSASKCVLITYPQGENRHNATTQDMIPSTKSYPLHSASIGSCSLFGSNAISRDSTLGRIHPEYASQVTLKSISETMNLCSYCCLYCYPRGRPKRRSFYRPANLDDKPTSNGGLMPASEKRIYTNTTPDDQPYNSHISILFRNPIFIVILLSNASTAIGYTNFTIFLPAYAKSLNHSKTLASYLLSVTAFFDLIGRIGGSTVSDILPLPKRYYFVTGLLISGVTLVLLPLSCSYSMLCVACAAFGLSSGTFTGITVVTMVEMLGEDKLAAAYTISLFVNGVLQLVGPPACGILYETYKSYGPIISSLGAIVTLVAGVCMFLPVFLSPSRQKDELKNAS